jgi:glycerophosphoryl diester phosphodiesterase
MQTDTILDWTGGLLAILPFCLAPAAGLAQQARAVEIIAHRGASHDAPENTLAAASLAWAQEADAVEIDVWLTKDGHIVAIHDATTKRTTGRDLVVAESTLAELRALDAGSWKGPAWAGEKIPTLEEIVATVPRDKRLFIEIKCKTEILPELERVLKASGKKPDQTAVISFDLETLKAVKARMPELKVYWVHGTSPRRDEKTGLPIRDEKTGQLVDPPEQLIETCRRAGLDGLDLAGDSRLTRNIVEQMNRLGLGLYVWTIDRPEHAQTLGDMGVNGITTNRPGWLAGQLRSAKGDAPP